jgi:MoaA/NifB/PqqE/SkfB family radical SAM enzyme
MRGKGVAFRTAGVSDGKGFVFVSHQGEIFPSGFLPVSGGNVLNESLTDVTVIAASLRRCATPHSGKASAASANTRRSAADSRARAYALTGDFLAEDPRLPASPRRRDRRLDGRSVLLGREVCFRVRGHACLSGLT